MQRGLYNKVRSSKYDWDPEYPYSAYDEAEQKFYYYKHEPIEITDEEYLEMLELSEPEPSPKNGISITLLVIGIIIYVGGFFAGIIMGENSSDYFSSREFDYVMMFSIWINAFISGTLFLGFAEIIKLLHNLNNKKL